MYVKITGDLYGIDKRLKEIDEDYFILFNIKSKCFEVHNQKQAGQAGGTYCLKVPYEDLDSRTVTLVKSTRREYMINILNEIERKNGLD